MVQEKQEIRLNKLTLQIIAMVTMLIDHMGIVFFPELPLLRIIGRLAFPIFAFFIAEGCERTHHFPRYICRMALFAVLSEVPYDLVHGGWWVPEEQNVLWTFLLAMLCIYVWKKLSARRETAVGIALSVLSAVAAFVLGEILHTDYGGFGVLVVLLFWICRDQPWRHSGELLGQGLIYFRLTAIELVETGDLVMPLQGFAVFAMPFLWLYDGTQGPHNKVIQYVCYAFYPVHLAVIGILALYVL